MVEILETSGDFPQNSGEKARLTGTDPVDSAANRSEPSI
jgi:hypothetical protein